MEERPGEKDGMPKGRAESGASPSEGRAVVNRLALRAPFGMAGMGAVSVLAMKLMGF